MKINGFDTSNRVEGLISGALSQGRYPHASVIEGGSLDDRRALAKKIVAALVCSDSDTLPCGSCSHCRKSALDLHPDILIYEPRKEKGRKEESFSVDYIREIRNDAFIIPNEAEKKIIVLTQSDLMNNQAQNAFLKILEEPPEFTVFILLCPSRSVFLSTILSRVTVYSCGDVVADSVKNVSDEKVLESAEAVALSLAKGNEFDTVKAAGVFEKDQKLLKASLPVMAEIFSEALRLRYSAQENPVYSASAALSARLSGNALLRLTDAVDELLAAIDMNANLNLTIARLCTLFRAALTEQE